MLITKNHMDSNIKQDTRVDESWEAYRFFQDVKNTIERVFDECNDTYPMIRFPNQLSKVLKEFVEDNDFSRVSNIMELIIKHGSKAQDYERDWNLYKRKPFKPHLVYPGKKKATKKAIESYYPTETKDVYKPSGCLIIWGIIILVFTISSFFNGWMLWLLITTVIPTFIWFLMQLRDPNDSKHIPGFNRNTKYINKPKSQKVIEEEKKKADEDYQRQLVECELWNNNEWPKLVESVEQKYKDDLEDYQASLHKWEEYWGELPKLIESEYSFAIKHLIWESINFDVEYEEEENPRRGATEDKFLASLKNSGVTKLKRDIGVDGYYPDFAIIDEYYFIDIEIDEPYIYDTGEPIHYIGCGDEERNEELQDLGAFVIRFTEDQIRHSILTSSEIVMKFQKFAETGDIELLEDVLELSKQIRQKRWPYKKAKIMANYKYREK